MTDLAPTPMGGSGKSIQADETYIGNSSKRAKGYKKGHSHKNSIVALVDPSTGKARAFHVKRANAETVREILVTNAHRSSELHTDESRLYTKVGAEFAGHKTVNHGWNGRGEYVGKDGHAKLSSARLFQSPAEPPWRASWFSDTQHKNNP